MPVPRQPGPAAAGARVVWLALALLAVGVACRGLRFGLNFPVWADEACLALNLAERDYRGLLYELDHRQMAPLLFLWVEKAVYAWSGPSGLCLRLAPLLAGVGGLVLFARLARAWLPAPAATLAVGLLAVSRWPIELSATIKPYAPDLLASVLLLLLATACLRRPRAAATWAALALLVPLLVCTSYPAVLVAGTVSLVLAPGVFRERAPKVLAWFVAFNALLVLAFVGHLMLVGRQKLAGDGYDLDGYMRAFWRAGFPHDGALGTLRWLLRAHVGCTFSYPVEFNGGGLVGLLMALCGAACLYRRRRHTLLLLCLLPYALHLIAALVGRYPYGAHPRLEQHLLPAFCLLAGTGLAALVDRLAATAAGRQRALAVVMAALVLVAVGGAVADVRRPYADEVAARAADVVRHVRRGWHPGDRVVVRQARRGCTACLRWQLLSLPQAVTFVGSDGQPDPGRGCGRVWFIDTEEDFALPDAPEPAPPSVAAHAPAGTAWQCLGRSRFLARAPASGGQVYRFCCDLQLCQPVGAPLVASPGGR
jgi:hypothetical protein